MSLVKKVTGAPLHWQILTAMCLGAIAALLMRNTGVAPESVVGFISSLGTLFVRLLKMMIVPLVATSIIVGVASVGDGKNLGRLGLKTFAFYMLTSLMAIMIGLAVSNLINPGAGVVMPEGGVGFSADTLHKPGSLFDILIRMIPTNPVQALVEMDMLAIIFFCLLLGATLTRVSADVRDQVLPFIDGLFQVMMRLTEGIIRLAPIGVFGLIFKAVYHLDTTFFAAIGKYMITITIGLSLHLFVVLPVIFYLFTRRSPAEQFRHMTNALLTAFSTSSSSATLPVTMECVEQNAGVSNRISSFVLPLGATVNMDGTALYECAGVLFIAQVLGVDLSFSQQMLVVVTALLASIGAAGIPSAGLVMIFIVLEAVGLTGDQVGVIVGAMLAVDRPLDMYRTAVNVFSDSVGTVSIAHSEGEISKH